MAERIAPTAVSTDCAYCGGKITVTWYMMIGFGDPPTVSATSGHVTHRCDYEKYTASEAGQLHLDEIANDPDAPRMAAHLRVTW